MDYFNSCLPKIAKRTDDTSKLWNTKPHISIVYTLLYSKPKIPTLLKMFTSDDKIVRCYGKNGSGLLHQLST